MRLIRVARIAAALSAVALAGLGVAACGSSDDSSSSGGNASLKAPSNASNDSVAKAIKLLNEAKSGKSVNFKGSTGKTIGVLIPWTDNEGFQAMYAGVASEAIKSNMGVITTSAEQKADAGVAAVEDFIAKKVDAIVLDPFDTAAFTPVIKKANAAGIPVVAYDQVPTGGVLSGSFASDNVAVGAGAADLTVQAGKGMGKAPGDMKVIELLGDQASASGKERHQGYDKRAKQLGVDVVASLPTNWDQAKANAAVLDGLQAHPDANAIYMASGCAMWEGVRSALKTAGRLGKKPGDKDYVAVISVDGCSAPLDAVRAGEIFGDSTQQLFLIGQKAGRRAVQAVADQATGSDKELLPPKLVTASNVNDKDNWANVIAG